MIQHELEVRENDVESGSPYLARVTKMEILLDSESQSGVNGLTAYTPAGIQKRKIEMGGRHTALMKVTISGISKAVRCGSSSV